jgi:3-oxoacyl-[acyl-carrier protein] reductase
MQRTALILGGSKGLGLGVATSLAASGVAVALVGRDPDALAKARECIINLGGTATTFRCDLADAQSVAQLLADVSYAHERIDILLLNGGGPPPFAAAGFSAEAWLTQFNQMFLNQVRLATHFLPAMRGQRWGRILVVSSTSAREPISGLTASNALRPALAGWAKTLAGEVAADGITVNLLLPGRLATERTTNFDRLDAEARGVSSDVIAAESQSEIPMKRYGTPAEFGAVAAFLAGDGAAYVTGAAIPVDGGLSRSML